MKKVWEEKGGQSGLDGRANLGFGAVCRLANSLVFGDLGGFISALIRLSIGLVSVSSRFCRWEGNFARLFSKRRRSWERQRIQGKKMPLN